jgi:hypothetical protein
LPTLFVNHLDTRVLEFSLVPAQPAAGPTNRLQRTEHGR